jgi:hypothetical protein
MCLVLFAWHTRPDLPLVVAANRDEFYARPIEPLHRWDDASSRAAICWWQAGRGWASPTPCGSRPSPTSATVPPRPGPGPAGHCLSTTSAAGRGRHHRVLHPPVGLDRRGPGKCPRRQGYGFRAGRHRIGALGEPPGRRRRAEQPMHPSGCSVGRGFPSGWVPRMPVAPAD